MSFVVAVIVTYDPELPTLYQLVENLKDQVSKIIVVDNGSKDDLAMVISSCNTEQLHLLALGTNFGVATAQNRGIELARSFDATHVILFDQDSLPASDMVAKLLACEGSLISAGRKVGAIGPLYVDSRQNNAPPFIRLINGQLVRFWAPEIGDAVSVDYLISSGSLISMHALETAGTMLDALFIDYIDIEWGLRARSRGFENFGCFSAHMNHTLGDEPIFFLGKAYPSHSPLRHYYLFRNSFLLLRLAHIPTAWKRRNWWISLLRFCFYLAFAKPRSGHAKMIFKGIFDGLRGRSGKLSA